MPLDGLVASANKKRKQLDLPIAQFIAIIVLSISIFLIIDFGRRAAAGYRIRRQEEQLQVEYETALLRRTALMDRLAYVKTDGFVEDVARNELKWSLPGETIVVVMATPEAVSQAQSIIISSTDSSQPETPLEAWIALFFSDEAIPTN